MTNKEKPVRHAQKPNKERVRILKLLPNLNKFIVAYLKENKIRANEVEDMTGLHRAHITYMGKRGSKIYLDSIFMFSHSLGYNFFWPILEILYRESPECRQQDPLYKDMVYYKLEAKRLQKELDELKQKLAKN